MHALEIDKKVCDCFIRMTYHTESIDKILSKLLSESDLTPESRSELVFAQSEAGGVAREIVKILDTIEASCDSVRA